MPVHRSTLARPLVAIAMVVASSLYAIAQQPPTSSRVRGTIEAVDGDDLAVKSRGGENAIEVHVFPEDMRGTGEGSRPFDLRPNSTMTNATVAESVEGNDGHILMVKYKDGEKKVFVSPDTPVVTYVPADKSELKAGAKVIAALKRLPDGSFETNRVNVGRDGITPPM